MKIIVLHGEDSHKSYSRLSKFMESARERGWEIIYDELPETPSLFGTDRLVIFRDYHKVTERDIKRFPLGVGTVVIYYDSDIPPTFLKKMPQDFKMEKFDIPKILFTFLENLYPGNSERAIKMLHALTETDAVELVFYFVAKQMRDLYWVITEPDKTGFPDWKLRKLKSQAMKFDIDTLKKIISELAELDIKVKTSKTELTPSLDLLIMKRLE
jgi:hypothetical protein